MKVYVISLFILLTAIFAGILINFNQNLFKFKDFKITNFEMIKNNLKIGDFANKLIKNFQRGDQKCPTQQISMWLPKPKEIIRDENLKFVEKLSESFDFKIVNGSEEPWDVLWTVRIANSKSI